MGKSKRRNQSQNIAAAVAGMAGLLVQVSSAWAGTNGTWSRTASGGFWNDTANWLSGSIATGSDGTADFSTLDISATNTVHLNSARMIGNLSFGDATPSNDWILDNNGVAANALTLTVSAGSPTITVNNQKATISTAIKGSQGLTKAGAGTLLLGGDLTYSGNTNINAGILKLADGTTTTLPTGTIVNIAGQSAAGGPAGTFDLNGRNQSVQKITGGAASGTGTVAGTITNTGTSNSILTVAGGDATFSGVIADGPTNTIGLTHNKGASTLTLTGVNTYTGPTNVSINTVLQVNGSLGNSAVTVDLASLGGSGTINGSVFISSGELSPAGRSNGLTQPRLGRPLVVKGSLTFDTLGSGSQVWINTETASEPGVGYDQIEFGSTLVLNRADIGMADSAYAPNKHGGDKFWVFDGLPGSSPVSGFMAYGGALLVDGAQFTNTTGVSYMINYNVAGDPNGTGHDVLLTVLPVPEPSSLAIFVAGAGGLVVRRQRRRKD